MNWLGSAWDQFGKASDAFYGGWYWPWLDAECDPDGEHCWAPGK